MRRDHAADELSQGVLGALGGLVGRGGHGSGGGCVEAWVGSKRTSESGAKPRWDEVGQIFAYAAALAQRATKIEWHQLVLNVTHHHSQATPRDRELAEATRILHRTTACALNWLLRQHELDAAGSIWDKRQTNWTTLVDVEAVTLRTIYDDVNCVAAGWVEHPLDVPLGQHLGFELWKAGGIVVPKPDNGYLSKKTPKEIELHPTPPIALFRQFDGDLDAIVDFLSELRDARIMQLAKERLGPVRGVKKMGKTHPWDKPDTDKEVIGRRVPTFAVGQPGAEGERLRIQCKLEASAHRDEHAERITKWKAGDRTSPFPSGTLLGHTFLGMPLAVPAFGAVLGAPHPSREEVEAELEDKRVRLAKLEEARREPMRMREERRERERERVELEDLERELEDEARRVRVIDVDLLKAPAAKPRGIGAYFAHRDHFDRAIVITSIEHREGRERATRRGRGARRGAMQGRQGVARRARGARSGRPRRGCGARDPRERSRRARGLPLFAPGLGRAGGAKVSMKLAIDGRSSQRFMRTRQLPAACSTTVSLREEVVEAGRELALRRVLEGEATADPASELGRAKSLEQTRVSGEDDAEELARVEFLAGEETDLVEHRGLRLLSFVDDQHGASPSKRNSPMTPRDPPCRGCVPSVGRK